MHDTAVEHALCARRDRVLRQLQDEPPGLVALTAWVGGARAWHGGGSASGGDGGSASGGDGGDGAGAPLRPPVVPPMEAQHVHSIHEAFVDQFVPSSVRATASVIADVPPAIQLGVALLFVTWASVWGAGYIQRHHAAFVRRLQQAPVLRWYLSGDGTDVMFQAIFAFTILAALAGLGVLAIITGRFSTTAAAGLVLAFLGVLFSIWVDGNLQFADPDEMRRESRDSEACMRRRAFLHVAIGVCVAVMALVLPGLCPIRPPARVAAE